MSYIIRWTTAGFAFGGAFIATSFAKITCQHSELGSELGHAEPQHNNNSLPTYKVTLKPALPLLPTMFPRSYSH